MWDLVPWPGIEPGPPTLAVQSLGHWMTREVPLFSNIWWFDIHRTYSSFLVSFFSLLSKHFFCVVLLKWSGITSWFSVRKRMFNLENLTVFTLPCCCCCWVASVMSNSVWPHRRQPPSSPVPGILQARTLEWVAISFSNAWKWKVKVKSLSHVRLLVTPWTAAYQAPPSMGF